MTDSSRLTPVQATRQYHARELELARRYCARAVTRGVFPGSDLRDVLEHLGLVEATRAPHITDSLGRRRGDRMGALAHAADENSRRES
jgi:hypothetical protein